MVREGIYRFTSIGRPVDPRYPTNRAVLIILPLAAFAGAVITWLSGGGLEAALVAALMFVLVTFGAWALTRELAPDDDPAAFVAMPLGVTWIFLGADSVLLVFVALLLARVVNRSTGLMLRPLDSALVLALTVWAAFSLGQPLLPFVGALAFALDATLADRCRPQWLPAAACVAAGVLMTVQAEQPLRLGDFDAPGLAFLAATAVAYGVATWRSGTLHSVCDVTGVPLAPVRVRAGMLVALLVAAQAVATDGAAALTASTIWASLVAVPLGRILGALRRRA